MNTNLIFQRVNVVT